MILQDRQDLLDLLQKDPIMQTMKTSSFSAGDTIVHEHELNQRLYLILEGQISLHKKSMDGTDVYIDQLRPGDVIGLISFVSDGPALTTARAVSDVKSIRINKEEFIELMEGRNELSPIFHQMLIGNLLNRYQHTVGLQLKFELLTRQIDSERNQLKSALKHLETVQKQLISQEKMALLGELSAGISHEMNNPSASLSRSIEHLDEHLAETVNQVKSFDSEMIHKLIAYGRSDKPISTTVMRANISRLQKEYSHLSRTTIRKLAGCSDESREYILNNVDNDKLLKSMEVYETGQILSIMRDSTTRISALVSSLRSFSKPTTGYAERVDIREGLQNTIQLLQHKLKYYEVIIELEEVQPIAGNSGELNQVWTNILDNACDALNKKPDGKIIIKAHNEKSIVVVDIIDNGPGISDAHITRVFDANFTTKNTDGSFGLGIGLTITRDIVEKHKGEIVVKKSDTGGAWFQIRLPAIKSD